MKKVAVATTILLIFRVLVDGNSLVCDCTSSSLQAVLNSSNSWLLPRDLKCAPGSTPGLVGNILVQVRGFETLYVKPIALPLPLLFMIPDSPTRWP